MKKIISIVLCLIVLIPLTTGVFAADGAYIIDQLGRVEESTLKQLNETAAKLKKEYGIGVFLAYVKGHSDDVAPESITGEEKDYVFLLMGERGTRIYTGGAADEIFSEEEDRNRLGYVHDELDEWADGIARYLEVVEEYLEDAKPQETQSAETTGALDTEEEETKIDDGGKEKDESFPSIYLAPIIAAVIIGIIGVIVKLTKKKA